MNDNETVVPAIAEAAPEVKAEVRKEIEAAKEPGPAHELRQAQALLAGGLFPGQMAPAVQSAFAYIGKLADKIELDAKHEAEFKARQAL